MKPKAALDFSEKEVQVHLAALTVMPVVRFRCCERLSKLPTYALLQDRSSCHFLGTVLEGQAGLYCSGLDWGPCCSSQQMQNC
eukprot:s4115_g2.t1